MLDKAVQVFKYHTMKT